MEKFIERFETLKARYISMLNWEKSLLAKGESEKAVMAREQIMGFESALELMGLKVNRGKGDITLGGSGLTLSKLWVIGVIAKICESRIAVRNFFGEWAEADPLKLSWDEKHGLIFIEPGTKTVKGPEGCRI